jgi:CHAT domain-containing protein
VYFVVWRRSAVVAEASGSETGQPLWYADWLLGDYSLYMPNDAECELLGMLALDPPVYPQVAGPVVHRYAQVMEHVLSLEEALRRISADVAKLSLSLRYVEKLADVCIAMLRGNRRADATALATILLRATEVPAGSSIVLWGHAACAYLQCVSFTLRQKPDVPLYLTTAAVADRLVGAERASAARAGGRDRLARALSCSGQLRMSVAVREQAGPEFWEENGDWRLSAVVYLGLADPSPDEYRLDDAVSVVAEAAEELREAADLRSGDARGGSLIMVAQALHWLSIASRASSEDVVSAAREALRLLDPAGPKAALIAEAKLLLVRHGVSSASPDAEEPFADLAARLGKRQAVEMLLARLARAFHERDLAGARTAALRCWHEIPQAAMETRERQELLRQSVHALDPGIVHCELFSQHGAERPEDLDAAHLHGHDRVAAYTHLAFHTDQHDVAIALLGQVHAEARNVDWPWTAVHVFAQGMAWMGEALSRDPHDPVAAANAWGRAARLGLDLHLFPIMDGSLRPLRSLAMNAVTQEETTAVIGALYGLTPLIEAEYGDSVRDVLHGIGLATAPGRGRFDGRALSVLLIHRQMFKAPLLGVLAANPVPVAIDEQAATLLAIAGSAEEHAKPGQSAAIIPDEDPVHEELRLLAHVHSEERLPGRTAAEHLVNVRRELDEYLAHLSVRNETRRRALLPANAKPRSPDAIVECLQDGTVLVDLWLGNDEQRRLACYTTVLALTEEGAVTHFQTQILSSGQDGDLLLFADPEVPGYTLQAYPWAPGMAELRVELQMQPDIRAVSRTAQQRLEQLGQSLFGETADVLRDLSGQGFRHLCLWPHGPLWNMPLQLLMPTRGRPLADDWTVTTLPALTMLGDRQLASGSGFVIASSPSGGEDYGLPAEPDVATQAQVIAASFPGARLLAPGQSTPDRIMTEASGARYLHLAAHGTDYPAAPAFACLYFTGENGSDGRLFAHQVVRHDLRGIDIVTLSACESALGRADVSDNLRGLASSLLQAGSRAVVAALWPVSAAASTAFFTAFYSALAQNKSPIDSFRTAQTQTRGQHPGFKDWGAFTFIGNWRKGHDA